MAQCCKFQCRTPTRAHAGADVLVERGRQRRGRDDAPEGAAVGAQEEGDGGERRPKRARRAPFPARRVERFHTLRVLLCARCKRAPPRCTGETTSISSGARVGRARARVCVCVCVWGGGGNVPASLAPPTTMARSSILRTPAIMSQFAQIPTPGLAHTIILAKKQRARVRAEEQLGAARRTICHEGARKPPASPRQRACTIPVRIT